MADKQKSVEDVITIHEQVSETVVGQDALDAFHRWNNSSAHAHDKTPQDNATDAPHDDGGATE